MDVPNHTQIPNSIIDEHMKSLTPAQFKVLIAICRKTIGWHKQSDYISISQIVELAGVSNKTVIAAVRDLEQFGFIVTQKSNRTTTHITLNYNVTSVLSTPTSGITTPPSVATTQDASGITTHTKETINKDKRDEYIPTLEEVVSYFSSNGYTVEAANKMYDFYQASISSNRQKYWKDSRGNAVKSWKQKAQSVWFKPEHKDQGADGWSTQGFKSVDVL